MAGDTKTRILETALELVEDLKLATQALEKA